MAYRVEIAPLALGNLDAAYVFIKKESRERAAQWLSGIMEAILSLEKMPARCPIASESNDIGQEIRFLLYGKHHHAYKIFFSIHARRPRGTIRVFHVRHGAMKQLLADDLKALL
jgi:plasmid stabilization system protein ParE